MGLPSLQPPVTIGIFALDTLSTQVTEPWADLASSRLGPEEKILLSWLKYHVRGEFWPTLVCPPDKIDTVELMGVIACKESVVGNSGPYSTTPSMLMTSLVLVNPFPIPSFFR